MIFVNQSNAPDSIESLGCDIVRDPGADRKPLPPRTESMVTDVEKLIVREDESTT
jgi:hypothetical protein